MGVAEVASQEILPQQALAQGGYIIHSFSSETLPIPSPGYGLRKQSRKLRFEIKVCRCCSSQQSCTHSISMDSACPQTRECSSSGDVPSSVAIVRFCLTCAVHLVWSVCPDLLAWS